MPLTLVRMRFGELKLGAKFLGYIPGKQKRAKLVKTWDRYARLQDRSSTLMYHFGANEWVLVWRWR